MLRVWSLNEVAICARHLQPSQYIRSQIALRSKVVDCSQSIKSRGRSTQLRRGIGRIQRFVVENRASIARYSPKTTKMISKYPKSFHFRLLSYICRSSNLCWIWNRFWALLCIGEGKPNASASVPASSISVAWNPCWLEVIGVDRPVDEPLWLEELGVLCQFWSMRVPSGTANAPRCCHWGMHQVHCNCPCRHGTWTYDMVLLGKEDIS